MTIGEIIDYAEKLPFVTKRMPYGPNCLTVEIYGKQFGLFDLSNEWDFYNLKANPDLSLILRDRYEGIREAYHMNKVHWNSIDFYGDITDNMHTNLIRHAYLQTVACMPKRYRIVLFGSVNEFDTNYHELLNRIYEQIR